ncbi:MAG: hypothetical protein LBF80_04415 [Spirochaetaceae bacterium]|jgi:hypothetical protein|nr:hypothetical protein [Spirochaetaceae bacterium]
MVIRTAMNGVQRKGFNRVIAMAAALILAASLVPMPLAAQTTAGTASVPDIVFPQWSKDLRRAEIVAFGTIPFSWLVSTTIIDISRTIAHNGSRDYWPWPLKPSGAPVMTSSDYVSVIGLALGISVTAAIVDHIIVKYKRRKAEILEQQNLPREPVIIRTPISQLTDENPPRDSASASPPASVVPPGD